MSSVTLYRPRPQPCERQQYLFCVFWKPSLARAQLLCSLVISSRSSSLFPSYFLYILMTDFPRLPSSIFEVLSREMAKRISKYDPIVMTGAERRWLHKKSKELK